MKFYQSKIFEREGGKRGVSATKPDDKQQPECLIFPLIGKHPTRKNADKKTAENICRKRSQKQIRVVLHQPCHHFRC